MFYDPVPVIESLERVKIGTAKAGGSHGSIIPVMWNGKQTPMVIKGKPVMNGQSVRCHGIGSAWYCTLVEGLYDSTEPKRLFAWSRKAKNSLALRKIMDRNPRRYKYQQRKVISFSPSSNTAHLSDGTTVPVKFGPNPASVVNGEMALIYNRNPRHAIGGTLGSTGSRIKLFFSIAQTKDLPITWALKGAEYYDMPSNLWVETYPQWDGDESPSKDYWITSGITGYVYASDMASTNASFDADESGKITGNTLLRCVGGALTKSTYGDYTYADQEVGIFAQWATSDFTLPEGKTTANLVLSVRVTYDKGLPTENVCDPFEVSLQSDGDSGDDYKAQMIDGTFSGYAGFFPASPMGRVQYQSYPPDGWPNTYPWTDGGPPERTSWEAVISGVRFEFS